ncbi:MAG TPA: heparinase II/III family protein, partial [Parvularculaceae bacterium]|nr:heparinase II/III family protein [Parvularculaceae bacterium]
GAGLARGAVITHRRAEDVKGHLLEIERCFGAEPDAMRHIRRFYLAARGDDLRGEDRIAGASAALRAGWRLRFHLHPGVKASAARDGRSIILALPNKEGWRFRCNFPNLTIDRSVYCGAGGLPQASEQIVIAPDGLEDDAAGDIVARWSFRRMDAA